VTEKGWSAAESIAGLMAVGAIFIGFLELAYRPFRLAPAAAIVALVAAAMSRRQQHLVALAIAVIGVCFVVGAALAVWLEKPLY
jgi:hypothetical protein